MLTPGIYQPLRNCGRAHAEGCVDDIARQPQLAPEAWKSARLLRAVPNCRLVLMLAYHLLSLP